LALQTKRGKQTDEIVLLTKKIKQKSEKSTLPVTAVWQNGWLRSFLGSLFLN